MKPDNMFISESGVIKLGNVGDPFFRQQLRSSRRAVYGTVLYMAPEVFEGKEELKSDVWCLGISLIEMAEGKNPFEGCNQMQLMKKLMTESPSLSGEGWSAECVDFVGKCVVRSVEERWTVSQLMDVSAVLWNDD